MLFENQQDSKQVIDNRDPFYTGFKIKVYETLATNRRNCQGF